MPKTIRVGLLTDSDVYAGTEAHILTLAKALGQLEVEPVVACPPGSPLAEKAAWAGIEVFPVAKQGRLIDRHAIHSLAGLLRSKDVQILHTHNGRTHLNGVLAMRRAGKGCCVATQHFIEPDHSSQSGLKGLLYKQAHHWVNGYTARFVAISEAVRGAMIRRHEAPDRKIAVVPNGIDAPDPSQLKALGEVRAELGVAQDAPLIVCTARLEKEKDVASLVTAFRDVVQAIPEARCVVAGDGSLRDELDVQVRGLGLQESVRLLGFCSDAHSLMRSADVFVLPSLAEPFGLVILEAMALGRPVSATRAGGPVEIIVDGETGLLVKPADPSSLAGAIIRLLQCPEEAASMGRFGHARFQAKYRACHMAKATRDVYWEASGLSR